MTNRRWPWFALLLCACSAHGAELARLTNGFDIRCERHEEVGGTTRLYLDAKDEGFVDVQSERVSGYELVPEVPVQAAGQPPTLPEHIAKAGFESGIDPDFIHSVVQAESGYNPKAVSPKGAQGLMQLMPATAARLGVRDAFDPADNLDGGSRYLRELLLRYNGDALKALAAYNAGPESVEKYNGVPPYRETRSYVTRVINDFNRRKLAASNKPEGSKQSRAPLRSAKAGSKPHRVDGARHAASKQAGHSAPSRSRDTHLSRSGLETRNQAARAGGEDLSQAATLSARSQPR